ncbi:thiol peroxidase [Dietzia sp. SLG310A2-38A2]|uniref:thiol peroxidase n=1 Tax=Dietzia sp. SLG310A2-38A2 TaxID=1630643 RepID=UPI0015FD4D56|nr:thiol peroxidase [Dietzia sp. SLG310A2-38A2]MBB1029317.1 thiol peroxidase [Dietzia sp. SLG310A2-38A2]
MATTAFKGNPVTTSGELPAVGSAAPEFELVGTDLAPVTSGSLNGKNVVLNIFPSVDTGVCAQSVRTFNEKATGLENTAVINVSADLPFALKRFAADEGIENASAGSTFRSDFASTYGVKMADGPLADLCARSVIVLDAEGKVVYTQLVDEITTEPDYDSALAALN